MLHTQGSINTPHKLLFNLILFNSARSKKATAGGKSRNGRKSHHFSQIKLFGPQTTCIVKTAVICWYSQLGEPRELEGFHGDLADAVSAQPQDLESRAQMVQSAELQHADLVVAQVPGHRNISFKNIRFLKRKRSHNTVQCRLDSQVSDLEARGKAVPSELSEVIVAQVQGFHRRQLSGPPAVYAADHIVMPGK